jgi:rhodanese-related sulfurtransferase
MVMNIEVSLTEFHRAYADGAPVVDVRSGLEYFTGHVPGAVSIPLDQLLGRLAEVPQGRVQVICASGNRSKTAAEMLRRAGRQAWSVAGGTSGWRAAGHKVVMGRRPGSHS